MSDKLDAATQTEQNAAPIMPQEEPSIANVQVDRQTGRVIYSDGTLGSNLDDIVQYKYHDKSKGRPPDIHKFNESFLGQKSFIESKQLNKAKVKPWLRLP